jgi:hypothetical protein
MPILPVTPLRTILDSLAKGVQLFAAAVGSGSEANTVSKGATNNVATLLEYIDDDVAGLVPAFSRRSELAITETLARTLAGASIMTALDRHYGGTGGLNRQLQAFGLRVHPDLRTLGIQIDADNAFPPAVVPFGSATVTGSGAATYVVASQVDTTLYAKANVVLRTTHTIGAAAIVATCTMQKRDGTTENKVVTVPALTASGVSIDIGTHGTDLYIGCSAVTITGGTAGETFTIETEVERTVAL